VAEPPTGDRPSWSSSGPASGGPRLGGVALPAAGRLWGGGSPRALRWLLLLAGIGIVALLLTAGPSSHSGGPSTTTIASPIPAGQTRGVYTFVEAEPDGRSFQGSLALGPPAPVARGSAAYEALTAGGCRVDPRGDAIIPGYLVLTNTSRGLSAFGVVRLEWRSGPITGVDLSGSNGLACRATTGVPTASTQSTKPLSPGQSMTAALFVVLAGYYTPGHPQGDPSVLRRARLGLTYSNDPDGETVTPLELAGPGVDRSGQNGGAVLPGGGLLIPIGGSEAVP
jgi:hypothetical protein